MELRDGNYELFKGLSVYNNEQPHGSIVMASY